MKKGIYISIKGEWSMWNEGIFGNLWWEAKIYNVPSKFGINGGRISKLIVKAYGNIIIAQYDREWACPPFPQWKEEVQELIKWLEVETEEYEVV